MGWGCDNTITVLDDNSFLRSTHGQAAHQIVVPPHAKGTDMDDQFEIDTIGMLPFERQPLPVQGTLYRCTMCGKRPFKVKGVLAELAGSDRKRFKSNFNSQKNRHMRICQPAQPAAPNCAQGDNAGDTSDTNDPNEANGDQGGEVSESNSDVEYAEEPPPPPLDPTKIGSWTALEVSEQLSYWRELPATIEGMLWIPRENANPAVECLLKNEHGANVLTIGVPALCHGHPASRTRLKHAEQRWKDEEHQKLVTLFERACAKSADATRSALEKVLGEYS